MEESEKEKENSKKKEEKNNNEKEEFERYKRKKSTLSLSEIPKIINEEFNNDGKPKKSISQIFINEQGFLYPMKLKNSFINEPINNNNQDDNTPSSLEELKKLINIQKQKNKENEEIKEIKNNKSNSIGKKEKNSKKFLSNKLLNTERNIHGSKKRFKSNRIAFPNDFKIMKNKDNDKIKNKDKNIGQKTENIYSFRKSDIAHVIKKGDNLFGITDSPKKRAKRKSIISQPNVSPSKIYTT